MQEVIVYRNPMEAAIWNSIMSSGALFPVMCGVVVFFVAFLIINGVAERYVGWNYRKRKAASYGSLAIATGIALIVVKLMWI